MENPGKVSLTLIEVQTGSYFGEDDIIRYEDVYARGQGPLRIKLRLWFLRVVSAVYLSRWVTVNERSKPRAQLQTDILDPPLDPLFLGLEFCYPPTLIQ